MKNQDRQDYDDALIKGELEQEIGAIAVFFDGTGNDEVIEHADESGKSLMDAKTNILRMYELVQSSKQKSIYIRGVGTDESKIASAAGKLGGYGVKKRMNLGFQFIQDNIQNGAKIYIFGFSRGATTARMLVNKLAESPVAGTAEVEMLGIFDTVASLGMPKSVGGKKDDDDEKVDFQQLNIGYELSIPHTVQHCFHAVAIDEKRGTFFPTLATPPRGAGHHENIEEVWFAGSHADVGGGWPDDTRKDLAPEISRRYADFPLHYMMNRAISLGLQFSEFDKKELTGLELIRIDGPESGGNIKSKLNAKVKKAAYGEKIRKLHVLRYDGFKDEVADDGTKVKIHESVMVRLKKNSDYRPVNLMQNRTVAQIEQDYHVVKDRDPPRAG